MTSEISTHVTGPMLLGRVPKLEALVAKHNRQLLKRGLEPITLEYGETGTSIHLVDDYEYILDTIEVSIDGHSPSLDGFKFHGIQMRIDEVPLYIGNIPKEYRDIENPHCDHCHTTRKRNQYAVIEKTDTGQLMVVGSTCYKSIFDSKDAQDLLFFANFIATCNELYDDDEGYGGKRQGCYLPMKLLGGVVRIARESEAGFVSNAKAEETQLIPTWFEAAKKYHKEQLTESDIKTAQVIADHINSIPEKDINTFLLNVKARLNAEFIGEKDCAFLASALTVYDKFKRDQERQVKMEKGFAASNYIGEIKKRDTFKLKLMRKSFFDNEFGGVCFNFFETDKGDSVVWKASGYLNGNYDITEVCPDDGPYTYESCYQAEIGDVIEIKATVKDHSVYKSKHGDVKTTYITRAKAISFQRDLQTHVLS
jgi:hypothetical protein